MYLNIMKYYYLILNLDKRYWKKSMICIYLDTQSGAASGSIFFRNTDSDPTIISGSEPLILWDHLYLTSSVNVVYNRTFKSFRLTLLDWNWFGDPLNLDFPSYSHNNDKSVLIFLKSLIRPSLRYFLYVLNWEKFVEFKKKRTMDQALLIN